MRFWPNSQIDNLLRRAFDVAASGLGLWAVSPILAATALVVKIDSPGPVFFRQLRIGKDGTPFRIWKFRTMIASAEKRGTQITIGDRDLRVTRAGFWLRKLKIDELAQLINVFFGQMSLVGPRPEVKKYVDLYTTAQRAVLAVRPGITDPASIAFRNESEILSNRTDPEKYYIRVILPRKARLSLRYIEKRTVCSDILIILRTFWQILRR